LKKYIFISIVIIIAFSCNNSEKLKNNEEKVVKKKLRPFFDSDKIDHYCLGSSDFEHLSNDDAKEVERKKEFSSFFYGYYPDSIPKQDFEKLLLKYQYKKSNLSIKQEKRIENVFSEKDSLQDTFAACIAEYRDIFIFKKKEKNVGIAKICFKCGRTQIIGSKINTEGFGLWSELDKLKKIVHPESYSILMSN
jgi:ABC-type transporter MlaC component